MTKTTRRIALILATAILACFFLAGCENVQVKKQTVTATVTDKEYVPSHSKYCYHYSMLYGKWRWGFKREPEEYNVTIEYGGITKSYDRKSLYDAYEVGDTIEVNYITYYDSENHLITEGFHAPTISLP